MIDAIAVDQPDEVEEKKISDIDAESKKLENSQDSTSIKQDIANYNV